MPNNDFIKRSDVLQIECDLCLATHCKRDHQCIKAIRINNLPAADVEPKQRWIPVTEDTPHSMVNKVMVFCSGDGECVPDFVGFAHFEKYHGEEVWYNLENGKPFEEWGLTVTHWMDKPLPPKRG